MAKNNNNVRGVLQGQEIRHNNWRDSRTLGERFNDSMEKPGTVLMMLIMFSVVMFLYPALLEVAFIMGMLLFMSIKRKKVYLPFRMPKSSGLIDYNTPTPGGFKQGTGIIFLGNEVGSRKELWINDSDARTHFVIFGSTGAGKALRKEELVLTPSGWVKNKDLKVGDYVMRPTGEWAKIIGVYDQGISQLYDFELEDGRTIPVTSEHLWEVHDFDSIEKRIETHGEVVKTFNIQNRLINNEKLAIKTVGVIEAKEAELTKPIENVVYDSVLSSVRNEKFDANISKIFNGSYAQREYLFYQYKSEMKKQYGFLLSHYTYDIFGFYDRENAEIMQKIAHSLGFYAKLMTKKDLRSKTYNLNDKLNYFIYIKEVDFIKIKEIRTTERFEECQCIKIDAADGLFVTKDYIVTHNTETLLSLAFNTLVHGSGFIYVDGKGDNTLFMKIFSMLRSLGREDDLLTLNYMTGSRDVSGPQVNKLSNTLNPLTTGTSNGLTELIVGLMGGGSGGGDGDMWKGRAVAMVGAILRALVWKRDNQGLLLDVVELRDALLLENIVKLSTDTDLPPEIVTSINAYLQSLPGYVVGEEKQEPGTLEQHGFLQMQFTRILGSLSDDYGYIFKTNLGEIDFKDVVLNNRVLCVLLPALEKSIDELANLGKIVVACLKIMMSAGLGDTLEGETKLTIDTKPTASLSPYMCILDEYGYYVVKGAAVMPAQARSLGFSMVFAGQDYPSFKKNNNSEEAAATIGNCNFKIFMKVEDPTDTFDLAKKSAGEAVTARATQQERTTGALGNSYNDTQNISFNKDARLDWLDLKDQTEGMAHIIFKSTLIRAAMFYANPKKPKYLRLNHFIKVEPPTRSEMEEYIKPAADLNNKLRDKDFINAILTGEEDGNIKFISELIREIGQSQTLDVNQKFAAVIAASMKTNNDIMTNLLDDSLNSVNEVTSSTISVFAEGDEDDVDYNEEYSDGSLSALMSGSFNNNDKSALLNEKKLAKSVSQIEEFSSSNTPEIIDKKQKQLIHEAAIVSKYPSDKIPEDKKDDEIINVLDNLLQEIKQN